MPSNDYSFGLDIAGFSTGESGLCAAWIRSEKTVEARVFRRHPFAMEKSGWSNSLEAIRDDRNAIQACLALGSVAIDCPIDCQDLPFPSSHRWLWQLNKRPVDQAFSALAPFSDRLGYPVLRVRNFLAGLDHELGRRIFETYPKAVLGEIGFKKPNVLNTTVSSGKKRKAVRVASGWSDDEQLAALVSFLGITAPIGEFLNKDEIDGIVCAVVGLAPPPYRLENEELQIATMNRLFSAKRQAHRPNSLLPLPRGYVLLKNMWWDALNIRVVSEFDSSKLIEQLR